MTKHFPKANTLFIALIGLLLLRLVSLALYPLMDTTEARYGEMARIMVETHNWVTPMFDYQIPFWGKPPMFTWLSAVGFEVIGINEIGARAPHLFVGIATLVLVYRFAKESFHTVQSALFATTILAYTASFMIFSGSVMTDTALTFSVTLAMLGFWQSWYRQTQIWGYLFFIGLALGLLSKGPLTLVLVGISLFLWVSFTRQWHLLWHRLPWLSGTSLMLTIALPWYITAELRTPGFLDYFLIGEHFKRFVVSGWQGDLYGSAHTQPRGMIWLLGLAAFLPWSPILLTQWARSGWYNTADLALPNGTLAYLVCWLLAPLILFTMAGNILMSYVMPALPAAALLIAYYQMRTPIHLRWYAVASLVAPSLLIAIVVALHTDVVNPLSDKALVNLWKQQPEQESADLLYQGNKSFSSQFYSGGTVQSTPNGLKRWLPSQNKPFFIIQPTSSTSELLTQDRWRCEQRGTNTKRQLTYCHR